MMGPRALDRERIATLIPHAHAMMLLGCAERWDTNSILCRTLTHLDPANPLRRAGRLATICGLEYAFQATALHGALVAGAVAQAQRFVAAVRDVTLQIDRLDRPELGPLLVEAIVQHHESTGAIYALRLHSASGVPILSGRAVIAVAPRA